MGGTSKSCPLKRPPPQASTGTLGTSKPDEPTQATFPGYERFLRPAPRVQPHHVQETQSPISTVRCRTRRVTFSTRSTGCRSCSGTRAEGAVSPRSWSRPCATPSMRYCCRRPATTSVTSLHCSTRARTAKVWPFSSTRTRFCQTLSCVRSSRSPRAGPRGASQLWLSAVSCADPPVGAPKRSH